MGRLAADPGSEARGTHLAKFQLRFIGGVFALVVKTRKGVRHPERHGFVVWWDMDPVQFGFLVDFGFVEGGLCPGLGDVQLGVIELSVNLERASRFAIGMEVCESIPVNGESVG